MEVILLERVPKLGQMGEVVRVKDGYARNFLLPRQKALRATTANKARFESQKAQLEARNLEQRKEADKIGKSLEGKSVVILRQAGETGALYGSVSAKDIAEAITADGTSVAKQQIAINAPIKTLGLHAVPVMLHPEVEVSVQVNVARSAEEAERQARGENVIDSQFEEDRLAAEEAAQDMLEGGAGSHEGDYVEA